MKIAVVVAVMFTLIVASVGALPEQANPCRLGQVRGFTIVRGDPRIGGIGALPNRFVNDQQWFEVRYNCSGDSVYAKRVDEGVYDVWFPNTLMDQVQILDAHPQAAMVYGPIEYWHSWADAALDRPRDYVEALGVSADALIEA